MSEWYQLENESFIVQITSKGAELKRLFSREWNKELLWAGDEKIWARSAPHLFPIVGKLKDDEYELRGKTYKLSQHGFSRDLEFTCLSNSSTHIEFRLSATSETFKSYPFCFFMDVRYTLVGNRLEVSYQIINDDRQEIYFSLGAHPGFLTLDYHDYEVRFEKAEQEFFRPKDGLVDFSQAHLLNEQKITLNNELFREDAMIFTQLNSSFVDLVNKKEADVLRMHFDSPYFGLWAKKDIPFICLEPWFGVGDTLIHDKNFLNKKGLITLGQNEKFNFSYSLEFFKEEAEAEVEAEKAKMQAKTHP